MAILRVSKQKNFFFSSEEYISQDVEKVVGIFCLNSKVEDFLFYF